MLQVLEDPALKGEARAAERHRALRQIADEIFDFDETARRAMAQHWRSLTEAQRKEFVELFSAARASRAYRRAMIEVPSIPATLDIITSSPTRAPAAVTRPSRGTECPGGDGGGGGGGGAVYAGVPEIGTWLPFAYMHWRYITSYRC